MCVEIKPLVESVEICWYFDDDSPARLLPVRGYECIDAFVVFNCNTVYEFQNCTPI